MNWTIETLNATVDEELMDLPADCQAKFVRISELLEEHGPHQVGRPHVAPLGNKLFEMRMKGRDNIARAIYIAATRRRLVVLHAFVKKTQKTPMRNLKTALERAKEVK